MLQTLSKLLLLSSLVQLLVCPGHSLCLGFLCSCVPWISKTCCGVFHECCGEYQRWLSPLIQTEDVISEYIKALAVDDDLEELNLESVAGQVLSNEKTVTKTQPDQSSASAETPFKPLNYNRRQKLSAKKKLKINCPDCWHD